ncbi:MAG: NADH-quinone oxidoreductase subunit N [Rikenellaceae bacterium]|jgi:NADH-quinone oxidoreductase subunit N|nr:NADH-quinone oxidoreductase subunit N [Rikenellaceae bacterium]
MDFSNFLKLNQEAGLVAVLLVLLICDMFGGEGPKRWLRPTACTLFAVLTAIGFFLPATGEAFGGMYVSTPMTVLMKSLLNLGTLFVFLQSGQWLRSDAALRLREGEFYVITLATLLGCCVMISAANFMMLYIAVELASLPVACLAAFNKYKEESAEAGAKYILISALSSGIMMFGLSYLYGAMGTLYFDGMASMTANAVTVIGFVFFFAGLGFKLSLVPFHLWVADVYQGAPTGATAYLSVVSKAAAGFVLMFTLYHVFGGMEAVWHTLLRWIAAATIVVGNLFAIRQQNIKRFFAFSSISQAGYLLLGIMCGTAQGMASTVFYVLVYLFSNLAAFGVVAAVENQSGRTDIAGYNGFFKTNPGLAAIMMLAVFSLAGIPPLAGFFSKFFIFSAAAAKGEYVLLFVALANTVVSLYYYLLIVKAMFVNPAEEQPIGRIRPDGYNRLSLIVCTVAIVLIGIFSYFYEYIDSISTGMKQLN